jgi:hypothetical protein
VLVHAQDAADAHGVETAVVDEAPDRLRVHAELSGDLAHAVQAGMRLRGQHCQHLHVLFPAAWAERPKSGARPAYLYAR